MLKRRKGGKYVRTAGGSGVVLRKEEKQKEKREKRKEKREKNYRKGIVGAFG